MSVQLIQIRHDRQTIRVNQDDHIFGLNHSWDPEGLRHIKCTTTIPFDVGDIILVHVTTGDWIKAKKQNYN